MPADSLRRIIHVDMDAFYASVEQRDDPALRGRPVVVAWRGPRSVVCAASYEARRYGIRSAMPAISAERRCPEAIFVAPDFGRYKAVSTQVRAICARYTPLIEPLSLDEAYLDVSRDRGGLASATAVAVAIRSAIREELALTASAGVAPNKFVAKIASDFRKPDGLTVVRPSQVLDFLAPLDVGKLPGVGKVMSGQLSALGLSTVAALREADPALLTRRFGRYGERLHQLARGIDDHPVEPDRPRLSISSEDTFAEDLRLSELDPAIAQLAARVARDLGRHRLAAHTVVLKLKTTSFRLLTRRTTLAQPTADMTTLSTSAAQLRTRVGLPGDTLYRLVGVGATGLVDTAGGELQPLLL